MPTVQIEAQLSPGKLLEAVKQMSLPELEQFMSEVIVLQAQRKAPRLSPKESELLIKINRGLPPEDQTRLNRLIEKRRAEALTPEEQRELLRLTDRLEAAQVARVKALVKLAQLRGIPLNTLMNDLGIQVSNHA